MTQIGLVTGLLAGGMALQFGKSQGQPLAAFALLFSIACASRCLSALFLARQSEPPPCPARLQGIDTAQVLRRFSRGGGSGILFYLLAVQAAVWLSGPFFTPYMLKKLHLSYSSFAILTAAAVTAKVISLPFFGRYRPAGRHEEAALDRRPGHRAAFGPVAGLRSLLLSDVPADHRRRGLGRLRAGHVPAVLRDDRCPRAHRACSRSTTWATPWRRSAARSSAGRFSWRWANAAGLPDAVPALLVLPRRGVDAVGPRDGRARRGRPQHACRS